MTVHGGAFEIDSLRPEDAPFCLRMTFPAYQHLLSLRPAVRLLTEGGGPVVQPVALVARSVESLVGLALADRPVDGGLETAELLSLFVDPPWRRRGVATALVEGMEDALRSRGATSLAASYMTGKPSVAVLERIWRTRGWTTPALRSVAVRFTLQEAMATPWYGRMNLRPAGAEVVSWTDVAPAEHLHIRESHERSPWVASGLESWVHAAAGFDPVSSVGLRDPGRGGWLGDQPSDGRADGQVHLQLHAPRPLAACEDLPLYSERSVA